MSLISSVESGVERDLRPRKRRRLRRACEERVEREAVTILKALPSKQMIGREKEAFEVLSMILQPKEGMRPLLIGPRGIGKESLIAKVSKAPALKNRKIVTIDCHELIAQTPNDELLKTFQTLAEYVYADQKQILYLQNIEKLMLCDSLTEYAQTIFKRPIPLIGSISDDPKEEKIQTVQKLLSKYSFVPYSVNELPIEDVQEIVRDYVTRNPIDLKVDIDDDAIDCAVKLADKYERRSPFPMKAIHLIQGCISRYFLSHGQGCVTQEEVLEYVSTIAKVPADDLKDATVFDEKKFIQRIKGNIVGQDHAIRIVADRICSYRLGLLDLNRPWGVFLFVGSTGVGKTELSKNIASFLFNDKNKFIRIDGSEYKESHTVSNLIGAPLGYEGNEIGGLLTEPLLQDPRKVVLIDELEKAHPDVQKLLLQILDSGTILDRRGKRVDCSQAIFIMTSNIGSDTLFDLAGERLTKEEEVLNVLNPLLVKAFSPELCNRFDAIVPFQPLTKKLLPKVAKVHLQRIKKRLQEQAAIELHWTQALVDHFAREDFDLRFGMRGFCRKIDNLMTSLIKDVVRSERERVKGKLIISVQDDELVVRY